MIFSSLLCAQINIHGLISNFFSFTIPSALTLYKAIKYYYSTKGVCEIEGVEGRANQPKGLLMGIARLGFNATAFRSTATPREAAARAILNPCAC